MTSPRLSVVLPVFDEAAVLAETLAVLTRRLRGRGETFEVLCVDDGSRDSTSMVLASSDIPDRVLVHEKNRGKGAAVRTGMLEARGDRIVFLDADLSTDLDAFGPVLAALDSGADVVLGSRRAPGAAIVHRQPRRRELLGRAFSRLARTLIAPEVLDFTCGFKGFRRDAATAIFSRARVERWAFDAEIVAIARSRGMRIAQVPVQWRHESGSKVQPLRAAAGSLFDLAAVAARMHLGHYRR